MPIFLGYFSFSYKSVSPTSQLASLNNGSGSAIQYFVAFSLKGLLPRSLTLCCLLSSPGDAWVIVLSRNVVA